MNDLVIELSRYLIFYQVHRSGWKSVIKQLIKDKIIKQINKLDNVKENDIIVDLYGDQTFGWLNDRIYKHPWVVIFHHDFKSVDSKDKNDIYHYLNSDNFIASRNKLLFIIVLTKDLQRKILDYDPSLNVKYIRHPTDLDVTHFHKQFIYKETLPIVTVGNQYRKLFSIYELETNYPKYILVNKNKKNSYLDNIIIKEVPFCQLYDNNSQPVTNKMILDFKSKFPYIRFDNNFYGKVTKEYFTHVNRLLNSVTYISSLNDHEYDLLFSSSIIFLYLEQAVAVNVVIECIIRNTPIIINRLPSLEEELGKNYPLFYDNVKDITINKEIIQQTYDYLSKIDKSIYDLEQFSVNFNLLFK